MEEFENGQPEEPESTPEKEDGERTPDREIQIPCLSKSNYNKIILGVCGGMGEYFSIEPVFFRLMFLFSILMGGWGIIIYLIAALLMPKNKEQNEIDDEQIEKIQKSNNVTLIAGVILLAGLYIIFDDFGYFNFLSRIGIPSEFILVLLIGVIIFFLFSLHIPVKETKELPAGFSRKTGNALFGGVCSGFAAYLGVSPTIMRLITVFLSFITLGFPVLIYLYFLASVPKENKSEI